MTWDLRHEELKAVLALPGAERYAYLIKRCAGWEEIWCLRDDRGVVTAGDGEGRMFIPIWPHAEYARACATGEWEGGKPTSIELDEWVQGWLSDLDARRYLVSAFPVPAGKGVAVEPGRLRRDLEAELALYE